MSSTAVTAGRASRRRDVDLLTGLLVVVAIAAWAASLIGMRGSASGDMGGMGMASPSTLALGAFVVLWMTMMTAMMLPAVAPVTRLYAKAAQRGVVAGVPAFVAGYLLVWFAAGLPAFVAYRVLAQPLAGGETWTLRLAGGALLLAGVYTFTPLKWACLRHCRSPLSFFMSLRGDLRRPHVALGAGARHGLYCMGCCWALMAVLVSVGVMSTTWMVALTAVVILEKTAPGGRHLGQAAAAAAVVLGVIMLAQPGFAARLV